MSKGIIGYTTGVFDCFHTGHLEILEKAKMQCDYLIVGVCSDALVKKLNRETIMSFENRKRVVEAIKYVDEVIVEEDDDKIKAWENIQFNIIFKGDDWKGTSKWVSYEKFFKVKAVSVVYFPYTRNISSSKIRSKLLYE